MHDLRALAERYVVLNDEIADVRRSMLKALSNGYGGEHGGALRAHPTKARSSKPGAETYPTRAEVMEQAAAAQSQILDLLKTRPMGPTEIAKATDSRLGTVNDRLRRLRGQGLVEPAQEGGWRAAAN
jgi:DNA-binding transcriptional ArsR family regulator